jgi:hypothetical protein
MTPPKLKKDLTFEVIFAKQKAADALWKEVTDNPEGKYPGWAGPYGPHGPVPNAAKVFACFEKITKELNSLVALTGKSISPLK